MTDREKLDKLRWRTNQKSENIVFYSYKMKITNGYRKQKG